MSDESVAEKLGVKSGDRLLVLNAPEEHDGTLSALPAGVDREDAPDGTYDVVQVFATDAGEFDDRIEVAMEATDSDGRLWISYPKKSSTVDSDLSRDVLADLMDDRDWRGARRIAVDDTWSALWFRP